MTKTNEFPILYKKDSKNKIRQWKIYVVDNGKSASIVMEYGVMGGAIISKPPTIVDKGKNIGRANETSYIEQALFQAKGKWDLKKRKELYTETLEDTKDPSNFVFRPMLANKYEPKNANFPYILQPKLDGVRCNINFVNNKPLLISRTGKEFYNLEKIRNGLTSLGSIGGDINEIILDGDIDCFGKSPALTFQESTGLIKRKQTSTYNENEEHLTYVMYDIYVKKDPLMTFVNRWEVLVNLYNHLDPNYKKYIKLCCKDDPKYGKTIEKVDKTLEKYLKKGYEGLMLRKPDEPYGVDKRPRGLLKYKKFIDGEYEIVSYKSGKGQDANTIIFSCKTTSNKIFDVRPTGTIEERTKMYQNGSTFIGKKLTVKYFELTDGGVPRFPIGIGLRDYE